MRNARVIAYEDTPRDVVATGNDYPAGMVLPSHTHKRGQCLYAITRRAYRDHHGGQLGGAAKTGVVDSRRRRPCCLYGRPHDHT